MNELIIYKNEIALLNPEIAAQIADFEIKIKALKEAEEQIKSAILQAMENNGLLKLETDELSITYVSPTERETFDSKKFRSDNPDLYDEYVKFTPVKSSIRIKVKS